MWERKKLGDVAEKVIQKNNNNAFKNVLTNSAEHGIISQRDFFERNIANKNNISTYYIVQNDDFVYNPRISNSAPYGPINRNKTGYTGIISPLYYVFRVLGINTAFIEWYFKTTCWHKFMYQHGDSGARSDRFSIKDNELKKLPIKLPADDTEQEKIAKTLNSLNNTIQLHERKCEELTLIKKALLQKLFPKKDKDRPEVRYKNFSDAWEQRRFKDISKLSQGLQIAISKRFTHPGDGKLFYITNEFLNPNSTVKYYIDSPTKNVIAGKTDILMTRTGNTGKVVTDVEGVYHNNFFKISYNSSKIDRWFLYYLLNSYPIQREILVRAGNSTIPDLNHNDFYGIKIYIPTIEEQIKVGTFLTKMDSLITLHQRKLEKLKQLKKFLLQNMFI
ncbi:restriction endonuclease subunit S [Ligilactobacillus salivarius]|nr:restriction endonuclease subunit S [Ligilactobacillus salivarius]WOX37384.1 restriction endonuclease subunit S [Ligilactobacillus salivarius]